MPETERPTERVQAKRVKRRREILHAALAAVRDKGYHDTTLGDIAQRLGIRKTALYHYFQDKDAILFACHLESLAELDRLVEASAKVGSPRERLAFLIREHVRIMSDDLEGSPLTFEVPSLPARWRAEIVEGRDRYEHHLRELVTQGIAAGEFREADPKVVVFAILGSINWIGRWYRPGGGVTAAVLADQFAEYLIGGLECRARA